jgi:predicted TIM-barrel fold metal-dependent hydrolase
VASAVVSILLLASALTGPIGCEANAGGAAPPRPRQQQTLRVSGDRIIDAAGNEVRLRGFQGLDAYPIPDGLFLRAVVDRRIDPNRLDAIAEDIHRYTLTDFDIQEIKSTGANVIRLWTRVYEVRRGPGAHSETALRLLESTINRFGAQNIRSVLVLAGAGENDYGAQQPYRDRGINLWDPRSSARADSIEAWGLLSRRFAGNPHVAAYDVMNEPMPPTAQALHDYYVDVIAAIRANDRRRIVILPVAERNPTTFQIGGTYDDDNLAGTFHFYHPHDFTLEPDLPSQTYPGRYAGRLWDRAAIEEAFDLAINLPQLKGKPIYVGEFGAGGERDGDGGLEWISDVLAAMNARRLHFTYHNYRHSVYRGYWTRRREVVARTKDLIAAIVDGRMAYEALSDDDKRRLFTTELSCDRRAGIKQILTGAFGLTAAPRRERSGGVRRPRRARPPLTACARPDQVRQRVDGDPGFGLAYNAEASGVRARALSRPRLADHHVHVLGPSLLRDWKALGASFSREDAVYTSARTLLEQGAVGRAALVPMAHLYGRPGFSEGLRLTLEEEHARVREENDHVAREAARYPGRAIAFCSVGFLRPYAWQEIRRCRRELRSPGLKLHLAAARTDLRDEHLRELERIAAWAEAEPVALLVHLDPQRRGLERRDIERFIERVLEPHPGLEVWIAHLGGSGGYGRWTQSVLGAFADWLARQSPGARPGLYFDLSAVVLAKESEGVPPTTTEEAQALARDLRRLGLERVVFGSDYPVFDPGGYQRLLAERIGLDPAELARLLENASPLLRD